MLSVVSIWFGEHLMAANVSFNFAGKTAIVSGSTGGLGRDIATMLHSAGANVVFTGRNADVGQQIVDALDERAVFMVVDVTSDDDIAQAIGFARDNFGGLDILVNNACVYDDPGLAASREQWLNSLNVNLVSGAIFAARAADEMRRGGGGVIVNLSSTSGKRGRDGSLLYPAAKAAILNATQNEAVTLAKDNIRVLSVTPAWTWSPAIEKVAGTIERADAVGAHFHPIGRIGRGEEVASAVLFACSEAASFMTGVDIPVDGGYTAIGPDQGRNPRLWLADQDCS